MTKRKAVSSLILLAFLSILAVFWRLFLHDNHPYLRGDVIRLIDDLSKEGIRRSPLRTQMETIRKEPLNQGWKRLATLQSGVGIYQTHTSHFIVNPSSESYDAWTRIYRRDQALQSQADLFRADAAAGRWTAQGNLVFVSASKGEDPNQEEYLIDYRIFKHLRPDPVDKEILKKSIPCGLFIDGSESKKLVAYPLQNPIWMGSAQEAASKIIVRKEGRVLPARPDILKTFGTPSHQALSIFQQSFSQSGKIIMLARSSDKLRRRVKASPGPYILDLEASASLAGSEPPILIIKMDGREIGRQPVDSEKQTQFYFRISIRNPVTTFCLEFINDYFDPETGCDRNIFISRINLWPDPNSDSQPIPASRDISDSFSWSWLEDSEDILYEATPLGMFQMFTPKDIFAVKRFFRPGIASLEVIAQADLAGHEYPKLGVFLDKIRVGELYISGTDYRRYSTGLFPVSGGWHDLKIVFENDFFNRSTREDRNIYLTRIGIKHASALVVIEPLNQSQATYTISYPSKAPFLAQLRLLREFSAKETGRINPASSSVDLARDIRYALVCPPRTELSYRIQIPKTGKLTFGYGASSSTCGQSKNDRKIGATQLMIRAKKAFHGSQTIYCLDVSDSNSSQFSSWREEDISLDKLAGKKVELTIEAKSLGPRDFCGPVIFLSNPMISSGSRQPKKQPNVILIMADALRADHLSCYGYGRKTSPNIDQFAREAALFESASATAPWTLPAIASLFTSLYPSFHGANIWDTIVLTTEETLPKILKKVGYTTVACVNNPFLYPVYGLSQGFDFYDYGHSKIEEQLQSITRRLHSVKDQQFFFFVHILSPHAPYRAPRPFCDAFGKPDHPKLDTSNGTLQALDSRRRLLSIADRNYLISQYDGAVLYLDDVIKRIFDHLKQLGIYQDSLLIFLSDHGEQFQEHGRLAHGNTLYQEEIHISLIMKPPAGFSSEALRVPAVVSAIDIAPTILDMIKIRPPDSFQGRSLLPLLRGQPLEEDIVFAELNAINVLAIQKGFYKYISSYPEMSAETENCPVLSRSEGVGHEELYDLKRDPGERQNLSARRHDLLQEFRQEREVFLDFASRYRQQIFGTQQTNRIVLDASRREQLRALGYIR